MVMPGDNVSMDVELIAPIAMDEGLRFAIREGGRTVGAGVVAKISQVTVRYRRHRGVAQLVEHRSPKPEVGGSSPLLPPAVRVEGQRPTKIPPRRCGF